MVAGGRREGLTRVAFQLDMGETEESSDFYNPQGIKEGEGGRRQQERDQVSLTH